MTGLTQEEQRKSSPFTLEAALEEEPDVNDGYINDALPFDKCLKADTQADEEEKKRKLYSQLGTAKTTKEQSEKEIKEWLGTNTIIKAIFKTIYSPAIAFAISVGTTIWLWNPSQNDLNTILLGVSLAIGLCVLASIADVGYNFIPTKMNEKDYMIKENVVDCPIAIKNRFLYHVKIDELYGRVNAKKNCFEWLNNDGERCLCWTFEGSRDKNGFDYQLKYLADQLEAGKMYKLSDIITDKVKKKVSE